MLFRSAVPRRSPANPWLHRIKTRIQTEVQTPTASADSATPSSLKRPGAPRQLTFAKGSGARRMLFKILKEQGVAGLYRGFGASMLNTFSMQL